MIATTRHHPDKPSFPRRWRYALLALLVACLAVAGVVLPLVWHLLDSVHQLPRAAWLTALLAQSPALSWSLMLVWGTAVSVALVAAMSMRRGWQGVLLIAALSLWAVLWYAHMPGVEHCHALYGTGSLCDTWQWIFSISLALATALYMFAVFLLGLSALGLLFTPADESAQPPVPEAPPPPRAYPPPHE